MSHQFKVGDLALVIKSRDPEDIGKVVTIEQLYTDDGINYHFFGDEVFLPDERSESAVTSCDRDGIEAYAVECLMPLRGDFQPEREREEEFVK
jgi:hypothetical protein